MTELEKAVPSFDEYVAKENQSLEKIQKEIEELKQLLLEQKQKSENKK